MNDELKVAMIDCEAEAINMDISLDKLESSEPIIVKILDTEFEITPAFYNESIGGFIAEAEHRRKESHLVKYLKEKYSGFVGIPIEFLNDELLFDSETQLKNFLKVHYGRKKVEFVDFELVADHVLYSEKVA